MPGASYMKWVAAGGIHLTLKFLGNVDEAKLPAIAQSLSKAAASIGPFEIQTAELGAFPNAGNPRVVWIGLRGDVQALEVLYQAVERALTPLGFPPEGRPFAPHLTLGRMRESATRSDRQQLSRALAEAPVQQAWYIPVEKMHVMKSELARTGATYASLYAISLKTDEN